MKTYLVTVCRWCLRPAWVEAIFQCEAGGRRPDFMGMLASEMPPEFPKHWHSKRTLLEKNEPIVEVTVEEC